ncbi:MAG: SH3 domain-containing protein [Anaerolineae bacterium]|nr:SH3 domain-containing protein [Anaerolineae bacterium]
MNLLKRMIGGLVLLLALAGVSVSAQDYLGVILSNLNIRAEASRSGAVLTTLPADTTVIIEARSAAGDWLLVRTQDGSVRGWAARRFVNMVNVNLDMLAISGEVLGAAVVAAPPAGEAAPAPAAAVAAAPEGATATVLSANLNVRDAPSTRGNRLGGVTARTVVSVTGRSAAGDWIYINSGGLQGWVAARYLRPAAGVQFAALPVVTGGGAAVTDAGGLAPSTAPASPDSAVVAPPPAAADSGFIVLPGHVLDNARTIFQRGQGLGNHAGVFIKIGDSNMLWQYYLCPFNSGNYDLGGYGHLQGIVNTFAATGSFCNNDVTAHEGFTSAAVLDAYFVLNPECTADEIPLTCALRLRRPAFAFIYIGVLDMNFLPAEAFEANLRNITAYLADRGVVPVLSTFAIADWRHDGRAAFYNDAIRRVAQRQRVPLLDVQSALFNYPARGTAEDGFHLAARDAGFVSFTGDENNYGRTRRELMTLELLNTLYWHVTR